MKKKFVLIFVALSCVALGAQVNDERDDDQSFYEEYVIDTDEMENNEELAQQYQEDERCPSDNGDRGWYYLYPMRHDYYSGGGGPAGAGGFWNQYYF